MEGGSQALILYGFCGCILGNMKIISAIYLQCHTVLRDDWISKSDTENDMEDGMVCVRMEQD